MTPACVRGCAPALAPVARYPVRTSVSVALRRHKQLSQSQMITVISHEHRRREKEVGKRCSWRSERGAKCAEERGKDEGACARETVKVLRLKIGFLEVGDRGPCHGFIKAIRQMFNSFGKKGKKKKDLAL